jgi:hypothetical protein
MVLGPFNAGRMRPGPGVCISLAMAIRLLKYAGIGLLHRQGEYLASEAMGKVCIKCRLVQGLPVRTDEFWAE